MERGIAVHQGPARMRSALVEILSEPPSDSSPRIQLLLCDLSEDWRRLDDRIDAISDEIAILAKDDRACQRLTTVRGTGVITATAMVAAIRTGQSFKEGCDFAAWIGLVPRQDSKGRRTKLGAHIKTRQQTSAHALYPGSPWCTCQEAGSCTACVVARGRACRTAPRPPQSAGNCPGQQTGAHCLGGACPRSRLLAGGHS